MAYLRAWNEGLPLGSTDPALIDDLFRDLKTDIRERMDTILGAGKWASDPVYDTSNLNMYIPWSEGAPARDNADGLDLSAWKVRSAAEIMVPADYGLTPNDLNNGYDWIMPVRVPVGGTVKNISGVFYRLNGLVTTLVRAVRLTSAGVYTQSDQGISAVAAAWVTIPVTTAPNWVVAAGDFIQGVMTLACGGFDGGAVFAGMIVNYSLPALAIR